MELLKNPYFISFLSAFILVVIAFSYKKITAVKGEEVKMNTYIKLFFASGIVNSIMHFFSDGIPMLPKVSMPREQAGGMAISSKDNEMGSKKIHTDEPDWSS